MHCSSCALNIDLDLEELPGIKSAHTSYAKSLTRIEFDPGKISIDLLKQAIVKTGYQVVG